MTKQVTHIDAPKGWLSTNDWDSHRELLYIAVKNTTGVITEFGSGVGSTWLLANYANDNKRLFATWENNLSFYGVLMISMPNVMRFFVEDWIEATNKIVKPGMLFIDCAPGEIRKELLGMFKDLAEVIVIHDSEIGAEYVYGLSPILSTFKYRLDYQPIGKPHTTAVSNFINVCEWV